MTDLGICLGAIAKAISYGRSIINYKRNPRKLKDIGKHATEGYVEMLKVMAENCPVSEHRKERLLGDYEYYSSLDWMMVADILGEPEVYHVPLNVLTEVAEHFGYKPEKLVVRG